MNRYIQALLITTCLINTPISYAMGNDKENTEKTSLLKKQSSSEKLLEDDTENNKEDQESIFILEIRNKEAGDLLYKMHKIPPDRWEKEKQADKSIANLFDSLFDSQNDTNAANNANEFKKLTAALNNAHKKGAKFSVKEEAYAYTKEKSFRSSGPFEKHHDWLQSKSYPWFYITFETSKSKKTYEKKFNASIYVYKVLSGKEGTAQVTQRINQANNKLKLATEVALQEKRDEYRKEEECHDALCCIII